MESVNVGAEVVLGGCGQWMVSTGTQTGEETSQVQISVPLQQFLQRIESFKTLKRQQVDAANRLEFYSTNRDSKREGDGETCARTDLVYVRRTPSALSHITVQRIQNSGGPTPPPLSPLDQLKQDLSPSTQWHAQSVKVKSGGLLHLPERLTNLEHCMDLYSGGTTPKDLIQRVQNLEQRLLQLESISPEYSVVR
ncbi:MAP3K12-binding inhibitory protein 1 [Geodia barretti]|uniref:MAP3K12-binding inhibitory protein 1 n=2 Tax=Geodia barretti TaxID=519541 RepID=A0AA35W8C2_GEOBA|nr:MAP3K12-binding inhibitory protein 1 [Geodia barretti]